MSKVWLNELMIEVDSLKETKVEKGDNKLHQVEVEFKVTHDTYHDVTTELYKNDFHLKVPEKDIEFQAEIQNYSTSLTNLYKKDAVADFQLVLIEKK